MSVTIWMCEAHIHLVLGIVLIYWGTSCLTFGCMLLSLQLQLTCNLFKGLFRLSDRLSIWIENLLLVSTFEEISGFSNPIFVCIRKRHLSSSTFVLTTLELLLVGKKKETLRSIYIPYFDKAIHIFWLSEMRDFTFIYIYMYILNFYIEKSYTLHIITYHYISLHIITFYQDHRKAVSSLWDLKSRSLYENFRNDAAVHSAREKKPTAYGSTWKNRSVKLVNAQSIYRTFHWKAVHKFCSNFGWFYALPPYLSLVSATNRKFAQPRSTTCINIVLLGRTMAVDNSTL